MAAGGRLPARGKPTRRRGGVSALFVSDGDNFAPPAQAFLLSPTAPFLPTAEEMGERTPAETAFLHFLSALRLFAAVRFPSRNRRFPDRCRSPDCASTAFRCRCLLLRQKLFVLPCRRLRNNYIGHTYLCRLAAAKARFDNRQSPGGGFQRGGHARPSLLVVSRGKDTPRRGAELPSFAKERKHSAEP